MSISTHNQNVITNFKAVLSGDYLSSSKRTYVERTSFLNGAYSMALQSFVLLSVREINDDCLSHAHTSLSVIFSDYLTSISFDDYVQNPYDAELRDCRDVQL